MSSAVSAPINREAVKVLAQAIGVREAARRMGLSEERVMKWSQRDPAGPWIAERIPAQAAITVHHAVSACPQPTKSASEAMQEANQDNSRRSRAAALRYAANTLEHAEKLPAELGLNCAPLVASVVKVASVAGDWASTQAGTVRISIYAGEQPRAVEGRVIECGTGAEQA